MPNQNTPQITAKEQESNISVSTEKIEKQVEDLFEGVPKKNTPLENAAQTPEVKTTENNEKATEKKSSKKSPLGFLGLFKKKKAKKLPEKKLKKEVQKEIKGQKKEEKEVKKQEKTDLSKEELEALREAEKKYRKGMATVRDLIAPSSMEVTFQHVRIGEMYAKTFFVYSYPRYIEANWLSPIVNFDVTIDISMFIYPSDSAKIMKVLRNKVAQMQSSIHMSREKGVVRDPAIEAALEDAEELRDKLQRGQEKFFHFGLYFTVYSNDPEKIKKIQANLESILGGKLVLTRPADLQQEHGFNSVIPTCTDELEIFRNMNTSPLSTSFPFTSSELTSNEGILYGLNRHNDSLVIFDRFSLENANSVIFAKSGAGKSYTVKLEILRSMMMETDVIVIDPENEYEKLSGVVGGSILKMSLNSERRINPFDLPKPLKDEIVKPGDLLRTNIITLHGLFNLMLGKLNPTEEGLMDRALLNTYALRGIRMDTENPGEIDPPTMQDLQEVLEGMAGAESLAERLQKYTTGTFSGLFNHKTNIDMDSGLVVFQIRDLEDALRPIAIFVILNYIWNRVRSSLKRRILVIDEAWSLIQHEDSAKFLYGLVKRARKYYLGISTITQDVEDFLRSDYGKPIISNSSMQLLLKQSPSSIESLQKVFNLTEGEKYLLLNSGVGQGSFLRE
jgi:conjugal transfer ATP-binding protein TraC